MIISRNSVNSRIVHPSWSPQIPPSRSTDPAAHKKTEEEGEENEGGEEEEEPEGRWSGESIRIWFAPGLQVGRGAHWGAGGGVGN